MDNDVQPPPLFPDDDSNDNNDEDLFATPSSVCVVSCLSVFVLMFWVLGGVAAQCTSMLIEVGLFP